MRTINPSIHDDPEITPRWLGDRDEVSFLDLLIVLSKSKRLIFWTTVIVAVLTVIISFFLPATYTATEVIMPPQNASAGSALLSQLNNMGPLAALAAGGLNLKTSNDLYISNVREPDSSRSNGQAIQSHGQVQKTFGCPKCFCR